jgi:hypothetical protein
MIEKTVRMMEQKSLNKRIRSPNTLHPTKTPIMVETGTPLTYNSPKTAALTACRPQKSMLILN